MTTEYPIVKLAVTLTPVFDKTAPDVLISVPGQIIRKTLCKTQRFELEFAAPWGWLEVVFLNKPELDNSMSVSIDTVEFFGISDPKFAWKGVYTPIYPEPWYSEQLIKPEKELPGATYLGWNGAWRLNFTVPVFTWMHQVQGLGWIYQ
jgi:hypothetical protein